ncbi:hypothetical protein EX30DRAFT_322656 [Ascodesmis nigricans]|uniref:Probable endonuclease LCL3 n=1 Tax=Ascodesmis nigricans TaxID=341454 RepID=A0A4S2MMN4_9PEZI|nr:hypothetical protein EX30DRAFT_322656 [Ascodesmis nigricans]
MAPSIKGQVKLALSGDTMVLKSMRTGAEKQVSLAYVSAPKLRREGDEPFAFFSRDYLRKLIVGKEVDFESLYTVPSIQREYGIVVLENGQNLAEILVAEGTVKVREDSGRRKDDSESGDNTLLEKLKIYEDQARAAGKGVWSPEEDGRVEAKYDNLTPDQAKALVEENKGKSIDGIVERVISGDKLAVRLLLKPKLHQQLVLLLAGVRCPASRRQDAQGVIFPAEEYGDEAKGFVEIRLLQRTVKVKLLGTSPQGQLIGSIIHPAGNIAEFVLLQGLGRCVDFHATLIGPDMAHLRAAEQKAKDDKLRLWKAHVKKVQNSGNSFDAVVSRIVNADSIFVRTKAGQEKKLNLSSVRQPKPSDPTQAPYQAEAKEFLRKKLIGKHVHVNIDGKRPAQDGFEERDMATVTLAGKNIALLLVETGYASVIRHRREDEDRSPIWDELFLAEETAKSEQRGMWSSKPPKTTKMVEASDSLQKAKAYLSFLQRQKRVPAIVDYVASGSRFKVIIPKENARLTFVLGGIRAPRTARNPDETSEPFGPEALEWSTRKCMQRDVEIDVEDIDKVGGFIGTMYVNRESVAKGLVEEGLATVHAYSAEKFGHANELFSAENHAKTARKGLWANYDPKAEAFQPETTTAEPTASSSSSTLERRKDYRDVVVANILPNCALKLQLISPSTSGALDSLMTSFRTFHLSASAPPPLSTPPKVGDLVSAKFSADNSFYRARVRHVDRAAKTAEITYLDYGNSERLPFSSLRPLPAQFGTQKLRPQAVDAELSFLQFPGEKEEEYLREAWHCLEELTGNGRQLVANVDAEVDGTLFVTLLDPKRGTAFEESVNVRIVEEGWARKVRGRAEGRWSGAYAQELGVVGEREETAFREHRGMWEYGDPFAEDE